MSKVAAISNSIDNFIGILHSLLKFFYLSHFLLSKQVINVLETEPEVTVLGQAKKGISFHFFMPLRLCTLRQSKNTSKLTAYEFKRITGVNQDNVFVSIS